MTSRAIGVSSKVRISRDSCPRRPPRSSRWGGRSGENARFHPLVSQFSAELKRRIAKAPCSVTGADAVEQLQKRGARRKNGPRWPRHFEEIGAAGRFDDRSFERVVLLGTLAAHGHLPGIERAVFDAYGVLTKPVGFAIRALDVIRRDVGELLDPAIDIGVNRPALAGAEVEHGKLAVFSVTASARDFI